MSAPPFDLVRVVPPPRLAGSVLALCDYRERGTGSAMVHAAPLAVPLVVSLGTPFRIALGRAPGALDAVPSFAAGLSAGPVHIASDGGAACVQLDLTPVGAFRLFGGAVVPLAEAMVPVTDVFGRDGRELVERVRGAADAAERTALLAAFVAARMGPAPSPATLFAWDAIVNSGGLARIEAIAAGFGLSRKRLSAVFLAETGIGPKTAARLVRFSRARRIAATGAAGWADVAAAAGYADQAHLAREFAALAGETPTAWRRRVGAAPWQERAA